MTTWSDLWVDKNGRHNLGICPCESCVEVRNRTKYMPLDEDAGFVAVRYDEALRLQALARAAAEYIAECESPAPDLMYRHQLRVHLAAAVREVDG